MKYPRKFVFYFFLFIVFSFMGSLMEFLFGFVGGTGVAYDKTLYEIFSIQIFFIPLYGLAGLTLVSFEKFLAGKKIKFIYWGLLNAVIIVLWELIGGISSLIVLGHKLWDYSSHPLNFFGLVSLKMFFIWLAVGYLFSFIYKVIISKFSKTL